MRVIRFVEAEFRAIVAGAVVILLSSAVCAAELPSIGAGDGLMDTEIRGQEPRPKQVEGAYNECLRQIDDEAKDLADLHGARKLFIADQSEQCKKGKNACIFAPRGPDCRAFVEDYAVEVFAE